MKVACECHYQPHVRVFDKRDPSFIKKNYKQGDGAWRCLLWYNALQSDPNLQDKGLARIKESSGDDNRLLPTS